MSLERAVVDIRLRPGNTITLAQVRDIIKSNGFSSRDAEVTVVGTLIEQGGSPALEVAGTKVVMPIGADAASPETYRQVQNALQPSRPPLVELTGTVAPPANQREHLTVRLFRLIVE